MIAGKTESEILLMEYSKRRRWYKTLLPEEKKEAMKIVEMERRVKISKSTVGENHFRFGKNLTEEHKIKIGVANTGKVHSKETKLKISKATMGKNNPMYGMSGEKSPRFGEVHTEETRKKISITKIGEKNPMYGKFHTEESRIKMSRAASGKNNSNWQNGKSFESYGLEFNNELREQIRKRDDYICQECGMIQEECISKYNKVLSVHHIDYDKKNNKSENLISLCVSCHMKTNFGRKDWIKYFRKIIDKET